MRTRSRAALAAAAFTAAAALFAGAATPASALVEPGGATSTAAVALKSVTLSMDTTVQLGTTTQGFIVASTTTSAPASGVAVSLQEKRGAAWTTIADGATDVNGTFPVSWTADRNTTFRVTWTANGRTSTGPAVPMYAAARVTWGSRPDLDLPHGSSWTYSFRINTGSVTAGHFEVANASAKTLKWSKLAVQRLNGQGLIAQRISFPKAGTYLLRGVSESTSSVGAGRTTTLKIVVR